ncbi:putative acetyltransferase [Serratia fonticola]|uniref:Putative acetyltransferase n=1 Tax=Serratia fonticola TaxID=47917 RepID=A0A559SZW6_SERFO|nr:acetyltransferase [Serratia fonticola]TQI79608.1 putative acetyltransferase [Serratia fonticola]TQI98366.1 putative acetyltransferase [Serratia fonticola]TVZ67894.1 putative acetyltransferase [Serratia fonticola]
MITIRARAAEDNAQLAAIWLRSVRATHHFLSEEDITRLYPQVLNDYLPSVNVWVAEDQAGQLCGFIGLDGNKVEMLFIDAERRGEGIGKALLAQAEAMYSELLLDVNEQNPQALAFYQRYGFSQTGRSELDGQGKPFPLLHMKLSAR